ncbi:hypothetical protein FB566_4098 [Stackebrandtia endophytica]|uniref:Uncharacterized protein n=1 Tax=Stackebrandtia endophytica TaxID=1496996 RepID=A0A543B144_9ACTN|nr:hypothetical protein [Stackebrandtia endophytica]TQL78510.1 hypothetical protein FB566_4098 [Stackebrandtia endophytica]
MTLKVLRVILIAVSVMLVGFIIWIDLSTDLWQKYVVISGLVAGLVTFFLTAIVIDRVIARSTHERWAPVTRLALGDVRRQLVADLPPYATPAVHRLPRLRMDGDRDADLDDVIAAAVDERDRLATALSRWSSFLSASADVVDIMDSVAEIARRLDLIGLLATELRHESNGEPSLSSEDEAVRVLLSEVDAYHRAGDGLIALIDTTLANNAELAVREPTRSMPNG